MYIEAFYPKKYCWNIANVGAKHQSIKQQ